jgi:hypothetical protein
MARKFPSDFDVFKEKLDQNEEYIRDKLKVNIENWAKFRFSIHVGNDSSVLESPNPISQEIRGTFIELAKSHYEVVNSLGYAKQCVVEIQGFDKVSSEYFFRVTKELKEFYIHLGSVLDNLARLIYILNDPDSATKKISKKDIRLLRHWIDWPHLRKEFNLPKNCSMIDSPILKEILGLRNNFIHNWRPPIKVDKENQKLYLFQNIRDDRNYLWPYEEREQLVEKYNEVKSLDAFLDDDFTFIEELTNEIFNQLIIDIEIFEANYNLTIKE